MVLARPGTHLSLYCVLLVFSADYNNSFLPLIKSTGSIGEEWCSFPVAFVLFGQSLSRKQNTVTLIEGYNKDVW